MITIKINVNNIDKNRLYSGEKGTYLNAVLIPTPDSEYSDYMIVEQVSKEERERGTKGNILGNASEMKQRTEPVSSAPVADNDDDLPF